MAVDRKIMETKLDRWVGDPMKERKVKRALRQVAGSGYERLDELFDLIKARDEYR